MNRMLLPLLGLALVIVPSASAQTPPGTDAPEYQETTVGGSVASTLSLTLGPAATFGAFAPGVSTDYTASTTGTVISTAGDATLAVADPSSTSTGHLVNGSFSLASPLRAKATSPAGTGGTEGAVGSSAAPTPLLAYSGPVSNDQVTIAFAQSIAASEPLRTGPYGKTLTFTLSTTNP
ncbi:hypothetical protein OM076_26550 [Solirubrobacter ginsenosidimutans]|uniref:WxL domain-containing protein n=1 Tax=Solirubrobacter ginsenosidimutans TaxID=490573 RepID=A0A9X3S2T2_9ACTN|nr:hypothetical protein [Solirubrobacter ginsenosidimutans]MDA0163859.1 hypothetical protein [Solirubrobacter ginsenosidimutans]